MNNSEKPADSVTPVKTTPPATPDSTRPAKSAQPAKPARPAISANPAKSVDPAKPADPAKSAQPAKSADPTKSASARPDNKNKTAQTPPLAQHLDGWRGVRRFSNMLAWLLTHLLYRVRYEGTENVPTSGPLLLVSNHTSMIDIPAIHTYLKPWVYWVSKKQLFTKPVIGEFFKRMGCVPVDRDKVDLQAARGILGTLAAGRIIGMFPQATRVPEEKLTEMLPRTGVAHFAIKAGVPIQPVAIAGRFGFFRRTRVIFGKPFKLQASAHQRYTHAEMMEFTIQIMQQVYSLMGRTYELSAQALAAENIFRRPDGRLVDMSEAEKVAAQLLGQFGAAKRPPANP